MSQAIVDEYVESIDYTFGYYSVLSPTMARYSLINAGVEAPDIRYACELGIGQGLSINVHSATSNIKWFGNDINTRHVDFAQQMADASGSDVSLFAEPFEYFCKRDNLPNFDFITMHGIWSWVSDENRDILAKFIHKKLNPGGVLYVSYNAYPGSVDFAPIREILKTYESTESTRNADIKSRIQDAFTYATNLNQLCNHSIVETKQIQNIGRNNVNYLAHEYFNKSWKPFYFTEMSDILRKSNLEYVCQANIRSTLTELSFTEAQAKFILNCNGVTLREATTDYILNRNFRQDYWIKGSVSLDPISRREKLKNENIVLCMPYEWIPKFITGHLGKAELDATLYSRIIEILRDHKIHQLSTVTSKLNNFGIRFETSITMINTLIALGAVAIVNRKFLSHDKASRLNSFLLQQSLSPKDISHLASPIIGGGIKISKVRQLFIRGILDGLNEPEELVEYIFKLLKEDKSDSAGSNTVLDAFSAQRGALIADAASFKNHSQELLKALKII